MKIRTEEEIRERGKKMYDWDINSTALRNHIILFARSVKDFTYKEMDKLVAGDSKEKSDTLRWLKRSGQVRQKTVVRTVTIARKGYEYIVPKEQVGSETEGE